MKKKELKKLLKQCEDAIVDFDKSAQNVPDEMKQDPEEINNASYSEFADQYYRLQDLANRIKDRREVSNSLKTIKKHIR